MNQIIDRYFNKYQDILFIIFGILCGLKMLGDITWCWGSIWSVLLIGLFV